MMLISDPSMAPYLCRPSCTTTSQRIGSCVLHGMPPSGRVFRNLDLLHRVGFFSQPSPETHGKPVLAFLIEHALRPLSSIDSYRFHGLNNRRERSSSSLSSSPSPLQSPWNHKNAGFLHSQRDPKFKASRKIDIQVAVASGQDTGVLKALKSAIDTLTNQEEVEAWKTRSTKKY